jgi:hypothetical protein
MNLEFEIDFESEEIHLLMNNSIKITALKDEDNTIIYRGIEKITSIELQDKLKKIVKVLFTIEEEE